MFAPQCARGAREAANAAPLPVRRPVHARLPSMVPRASTSRVVIQRKCACDSSATPCAKCSGAKDASLASPLVQRFSKPGAKSTGAVEGEGVAFVVNHSVKHGGQPLDLQLRSFYEPRFGHDFGAVRIHTGQSAAESAQAFSANAFTAGNHIVFGAGRFSPSTSEGNRLLAHELAHVVQQSRGGAPPSSGAAAMALETHADRAAAGVSEGAESVDVGGAVGAGLQMDAEAYIWDPHVDGYGHAAIKLCDGTYISWWPTGPGSTKEQYWSGRPGGANSYADDVGPGGEGKVPDHVYNLGCDCLDEKAIKDWYVTNFSGNPDAKWAVLRNSCSDVAHMALNKGSNVTNPCYLSLSHSNIFWTPKDLGAYAGCQSRWCASKKAGALNATGRYLWENVKESVGGWAVNTAKSLWWKTEIVTH